MTRMLTILLVLPLVSPVFARDQKVVVGSGKVVSETRKLAEFDEIELRIAGDVHVTIGKPTPLEIKGDDNILPLIKTEVTDRRLVISADRSFRTKQAPNLKVTVANLTAAEIDGSGDLHIQGFDNQALSLAINGSGDMNVTGKTGRLTVNIAGSGDARVTGKAEQLAVNIAGSGDAHLTGKAEQLAVSIAGSGDVHAFNLNAHDGTVRINGSGDAKVSVAHALSIQIFGSGDVHYQGNPQVVQQIAGSGDVKRRK